MSKPFINLTFARRNDKSGKKSVAEYIYVKKEKDGTKKNVKFETKYVSTIDIPYGKYILK